MKVAFITGSGTGLGKRTAIELASRGFRLVLNYVNSEKRTRELAQSLEKEYGISALVLKGDVSRFEDCQLMVTEAIEHFGRIDALVNNAGPYVFERKKMTDYAIDEWNYMINGNLNSVFYLCKLIIPFMRRQGGGRIINMGFDRAETAPGWKYRSAFAASKAGLVSLTKTLAIEEAKHKITVNMVCPGDIAGDWKEADISQAKEELDAATPVQRAGTGEDIARTVSFLCEEQSDFITGAVISVTGGKDVLAKVQD
jgi:3-oxoacyl-[acyl-carrier protein] reductase